MEDVYQLIGLLSTVRVAYLAGLMVVAVGVVKDAELGVV